MIRYNVEIVPLSERCSTIEHEKVHSNRSHRFYEYRDSPIDLPVIRIPINLPVYRLANYRTNLLQLKWIKDNRLTANYFQTSEENEDAQRIQHRFLWELAQTEKESIASIVERLKAEKQREPILITSSGVVVNGNRRLSSMRELTKTPGTEGEFEHVDCMILPPEATEDDLKEIEVRLQMTPETRLPYDWIGECIAIKDLRSRNKSFELIGGWMRLDPSKVRNKLLVLNEIDLYLNDWKKGEIDYDSLSDAEEIITQITKRIKSKEGIQQELARRIGWILLDQRGKDGRVYELRDVTGNLTTQVISKLQEVYSGEIATSQPRNDEVLELELEDSDSNITEQATLSFIDRSYNNQDLQQEIINICKVVVETKKQQRSGENAKRSVQDAHTSLLEVDLTTADVNTLEAIRRQLDAIESRVILLKTQLDRMQANAVDG